MGLEEHLIGMFRHDFEFVDGHRSHLGEGAATGSPAADPAPAHAAASGIATLAPAPQAATATVGSPTQAGAALAEAAAPDAALRWSPDGEAELHKIPFFVRAKVRRNTEAFARDRGIALIDAETLYDAKAHYSR
jgi:light-independent protochlorophyllide reductase subunit B